ncbi:hypothetical protein P5494_005555 [Bacillus velezensis]|uniref:hypothetical protein n=1 Tax=Bacillus velezensis TaxID=492670 RepID=UPI002452F4B2|nr:hypothetical protein [Bacillus velezensis]MDH3122571.1 hypothetical protein [Bacillus velezensis]
MESKNEVQGKIAGQFQVNENKYLIVEITSEEKARLFDINVGSVSVGSINVIKLG